MKILSQKFPLSVTENSSHGKFLPMGLFEWEGGFAETTGTLYEILNCR